MIRPLLIQKIVDLRPGERHADKAVAKRLDGKKIAISNRSSRNVRADATRIHEREIGVERSALGIGNQVAQRRLASFILRMGDVCCSLANDTCLGNAERAATKSKPIKSHSARIVMVS